MLTNIDLETQILTLKIRNFDKFWPYNDNFDLKIKILNFKLKILILKKQNFRQTLTLQPNFDLKNRRSWQMLNKNQKTKTKK